MQISTNSVGLEWKEPHGQEDEDKNEYEDDTNVCERTIVTIS